MNEIDIQPSDRLLSSWKEIAVCLNRGVRTVQRWEQFGLPVQRPAGAGSNVVLAVESELIQWASDWKNHCRPGNERTAVTGEDFELRQCAARLNEVKRTIEQLNVRLQELETRLESLKPVKRFRLAA